MRISTEVMAGCESVQGEKPGANRLTPKLTCKGARYECRAKRGAILTSLVRCNNRSATGATSLKLRHHDGVDGIVCRVTKVHGADERALTTQIGSRLASKFVAEAVEARKPAIGNVDQHSRVTWVPPGAGFTAKLPKRESDLPVLFFADIDHGAIGTNSRFIASNWTRESDLAVSRQRLATQRC